MDGKQNRTKNRVRKNQIKNDTMNRASHPSIHPAQPIPTKLGRGEKQAKKNWTDSADVCCTVASEQQANNIILSER